MKPLYYDKSILGPTETISQIFDEEIYNPTWFLLEDSKIEKIVDIGAYIGSFTLWCLEKFPSATIHSYEPDPSSFSFFKKNVDASKCSHQIKLFNVAVSYKKTKLELFRFKQTPSCNTVIYKNHPRGVEFDSIIKVQSKPMKEVLKQIGGKIDFLKIDCEGAEYDILESLSKHDLKQIKYIALEYHEFDNISKHKAKRLDQFLRNAGFASQIIPENIEKNKGVGYIYAAQIKSADFLNKLFDGETKRITKSIILPTTLQERLNKLQKEFDERTEWSLKLQKENQSKDAKIIELQKEFDERTKWTLELEKKSNEYDKKIRELENNPVSQESYHNDLQKEIETKESEIEQIRSDFYKQSFELDKIKNSLIFQFLQNFTKNLDKNFPPGTKRGEMIRLLRNAYLTNKNQGFRVLMAATKEKLGAKKSKKITVNQSKRTKLKTIDKNKKGLIFTSKIENSQDQSLRKFLTKGSANITNLEKFPEVSIIILTYNQLELLKKNLEKIQSKTTYKNYEIIIVTNDKDKNSKMRKFLDSLKNPVYIYEKEYSFAGMNNFGVSKAAGDYLLFLNDDVEIVNPNWLESLLCLSLQESTGVVGGKLLFPNGKLQEAGCIVWRNGHGWNYGRNANPEDPEFNYVRDVDYCSGCCLFVKKQLFDKIGGFDVEYHPAYCEDADLCFSIHNLGYRVLYQPLASIIHHEGMTQGTNENKGIKSYQIVNQKKFAKKWENDLKSHTSASDENSLVECNKKDGVNILYIDHYIPEPDKDSGSLRTYNMLGILEHMNNRITFWPDNLNKSEPYTSELQQKGIEVIYGAHNFEKFLDERKNMYDIAVLVRPYVAIKYIDLIKSKIPSCKIIYDSIDLHFLRMNRQTKFEKTDKKEIKKMHDLELYLMQNSDMTLLTSEEEAKILHKEDDSLNFALVPNVHIPINDVPDFEGRKNLMFLGGFQHPPNIDATKYLVTEIFPTIRKKLPGVKLNIVGSNPPKSIKDLEADDIIVTGYVPDISGFLKESKVMLSPLRYGAGVKGKITQSLAFGLPVITTKIGAEGINLTHSENCMIANNSEEFIENTIKVYEEKELWSKLSKNGLKVANDYSPEKIRNVFKQII